MKTEILANQSKPQAFFKRHGQSLSGAVVGGITASLITIMLVNPAPSNASAAVLLSPLATIASQINGYMGVMQDWVDKWVPNLDGILNNRGITSAQDIGRRIEGSVKSAMEESVGYHLQGGGPYRDMLNNSLSLLEGADGFDMEKAASVLAPPGMLPGGNVNDAEVNAVWNHAILMTGDEPIAPINAERRNTLAGTEYEYKRVQTLQTRMMAQDAIQNYPLAGPRLEGYRSHLGQISNGAIGGMTPGQLSGAQLDMVTSVAIPVALDQLEASLRQERLLGTILAQDVRRTTEELIQDR